MEYQRLQKGDKQGKSRKGVCFFLIIKGKSRKHKEQIVITVLLTFIQMCGTL